MHLLPVQAWPGLDVCQVCAALSAVYRIAHSRTDPETGQEQSHAQLQALNSRSVVRKAHGCAQSLTQAVLKTSDRL